MVNWRADKLALRNCRRRTLSFGLPNVEQRLRERANSRRPACGPSFLVLRCPRTSPSPGLSSQRPILAEENPTPLPLRFSKPLFNFVVYDFPKTSKLGGGGIPRQKKKNGRAGRHEISIVEIPFCRGQGSPFPGSLVCAGFFASGAEWFLVKRSDVPPSSNFPRSAQQKCSVFSVPRLHPRAQNRGAGQQNRRGRRRRSQEQGGADRTRTDGDIFPSRDTRKGWRALQEPRSTTHAS